MKIFLSSFIILFLSFSASSQFYNTGQAPASVKWSQIKTDNFQVIYPDDFYQEANRVANFLEYMYSYISEDFSLQPKKISVILYNQSVISNGYVAWAPRRSEWITTPPRNSYSQDWMEQLILHEFRHVVQINNLEQGITRILNIVFGEAATGAIAGYLPFWFLEGDAVLAETKFSSSGRGRLADFDRELRAIELDRSKRFSYDESYLGSFKYYVPDYYSYGYQMVSYARLKYGVNFWQQTLNEVAKKPFLVAPFYLGLRKGRTKSKSILYHNTFDSLKILWTNALDTNTSIKDLYHPICQNKYYTQYKYVQPARNKIFAVQTGIDDITRFVWLTNSSESRIHTPGLYYNTRVSISDTYIAWEEIIPDMRWARRNYSVIKILNRQNGKIKVIQNKTRWFSPYLLSGTDSLVVLNIDNYNNFSLLIYDIQENALKDTLPLTGIRNAFCPVWLNENEIACIILDQDGKKIVKCNLNTHNISVLYNAGFIDIDNLSIGENSLFFSYEYEMVRNIYRLNLQTSEVFRLTQSRHGADFPYYDTENHILYYSDYTVNGYRPASIKPARNNEVPLTEISEYNYPWASALSENTACNLQQTDILFQEYPTKPYSRFLHSFNIHSWLPFYVDPNDLLNLNPVIYAGFTLFSQNKLSTLTSQISYFYRDNKHYIEPRFIFQGIYPVIELSALFSSQPSIYFWPENLERPPGMKPYYSLSIETYIPMQLTHNKYYRNLRPEISFRYINRYFYTRNLGIQLGYNYIETSIYASNLLKQSHRDIQPRFGQTLFFAYNWPVFHPEVFTRTLTGNFNLYLPGIIRHHGIRLNISYEESEENKVPILTNRISLPRGNNYDIDYYNNLKGLVEYTLPILYPDLTLGPIAYIKRIHATLYYDAAKIRYPEIIDNSLVVTEDFLSSFGLTLYVDMHFLRFFMPFRPGFRISFIPESQSFDFGFGISVNTLGY